MGFDALVITTGMLTAVGRGVLGGREEGGRREGRGGREETNSC